MAGILWDGGAAPAPTPCPASRRPSPIGGDITINIEDTGGGLLLARFRPCDIVTSVPAEMGSEFPPCVNPFITTDRIETWEWTLKDGSDVVIPPAQAEDAYGGYTSRYEFTCDELGANTVGVYVGNPTGAGQDFVTAFVTVDDPLALCPA